MADTPEPILAKELFAKKAVEGVEPGAPHKDFADFNASITANLPERKPADRNALDAALANYLPHLTLAGNENKGSGGSGGGRIPSDARKQHVTEVIPVGGHTSQETQGKTIKHVGGSTITLNASDQPTDIALPRYRGMAPHLKLEGDNYHEYLGRKRKNDFDYQVTYDLSGEYRVGKAGTKETTWFKADGSSVHSNGQSVDFVRYQDGSSRSFERGSGDEIQSVIEKPPQGPATQWQVEGGKLIQYTVADSPQPTGRSIMGNPVVDAKGVYKVVGDDGKPVITFNTDGTRLPADAQAFAAEAKPEVWGPNGRQFTPKGDGSFVYSPGGKDTLWWIAKDALRHWNGKEPPDAEVLAQMHQIAKDNGKEGPGISPNEINKPLKPTDKLIIRTPQKFAKTGAESATSGEPAPDGPHKNADGSTTIYEKGRPIEVDYKNGDKATFKYTTNGKLIDAVLPGGVHYVWSTTYNDEFFHQMTNDGLLPYPAQIQVLSNGVIQLATMDPETEDFPLLHKYFTDGTHKDLPLRQY
jgi:hypothetical protein